MNHGYPSPFMLLQSTADVRYLSLFEPVNCVIETAAFYPTQIASPFATQYRKMQNETFLHAHKNAPQELKYN
jgi:hypothetical protein